MWRLVVALAFGSVIGHTGVALGMGGNLDKPSVAIPTEPATKKGNPVAERIAAALLAHEKAFAGGSFVNAHSELFFVGGANEVNALLGDLAKAEGATVRVRLSKEAGVARRKFATAGGPPEAACDCRVEHNGWGDAAAVTVTVYLGGGRIDPADLELPAVAGRTAGDGK